MLRMLRQELPFAGIGGCPSQCTIEVHRGDNGIVVVVAEENKSSFGTSVTNGAEFIFAEVLATLPLDLARIVFVERYVRPDGNQDHAQVRFTCIAGAPLGVPSWSHIEEFSLFLAWVEQGIVVPGPPPREKDASCQR